MCLELGKRLFLLCPFGNGKILWGFMRGEQRIDSALAAECVEGLDGIGAATEAHAIEQMGGLSDRP